nr:hypothetical protein BNIPNGOD_00062 [Salmonella enterica subsp. enterica serovar Typhimurium]
MTEQNENAEKGSTRTLTVRNMPLMWITKSRNRRGRQESQK